MTKLTIAVFCFFLFPVIAFSQREKFDSLVNLLPSAAEDTNKVMLYWNIGASMLYQNAPTSLGYFKQGIALALKINFDAGAERCYSGAAFSHTLNAKYDSGLIYLDSATPYAHKVGNQRRLALLYINKADALSNLQKLGPALKACDTAIRYAEAVKSNDALGRIHAIIGGIHISQKRYDDATEYFQKAAGYYEIAKSARMVAMNYSEMADVKILTEKPNEAIPLLQKAIKIADSLDDIENLSAYALGLANAYVMIDQFSKAQEMTDKALMYVKQTGNRKQEAMVYDAYYMNAIKQNKFDEAIEYELKAYRILKEEKDLLREEISTSNLADAYSKAGNPAKAFEFLQLSKQLKDSLMNQQFNEETARLQTSFKVLQKDKEIEILNKDNELQQQRFQKQRLIMIGLVVLVLLIGGAVWLILNRNKLRERMKELELRNRIAADLHDEVGSSLSSIHMLSQMANQKNADGGNKDILTRMSTNARETMEKMGDIVWMIKPSETESGSLKQRMERFAYEICDTKNIKLSLQLEDLDQLKLSIDQRKNVYLIFKEVINNAVKYSGTESITVTAFMKNKELLMRIEDKGVGFDTSLAKPGNGLSNIRNRANDIKGHLAVNSVSNAGTAVELRVPVG